jgi:polynucleotide 5'-kinase involved in rRNA processing
LLYLGGQLLSQEEEVQKGRFTRVSSKKERKVYFLDCDLGQPMFGLPGCVSLFEFSRKDYPLTNLGGGVPFSGEKNLLLSLYVGEFSPHQEMNRFLDCVRYLAGFV